MAKDDFTEPQAPEYAAAVEGSANKPAQVEAQQDPVVDTAPVSEPADAPQPTFNVSLASDSELEAPVFVSVARLYNDVEPLPHPNDITDSEGEYLPGYDENTETLLETADGWERPESAEQSEAVANLDEYGRLEVSDTPVEVPAGVAEALGGTPFLKIEQVRS